MNGNPAFNNNEKSNTTSIKKSASSSSTQRCDSSSSSSNSLVECVNCKGKGFLHSSSSSSSQKKQPVSHESIDEAGKNEKIGTEEDVFFHDKAPNERCFFCETCSVCQGNGMIPVSTTFTCGKCNGFGFIHSSSVSHFPTVIGEKYRYSPAVLSYMEEPSTTILHNNACGTIQSVSESQSSSFASLASTASAVSSGISDFSSNRRVDLFLQSKETLTCHYCKKCALCYGTGVKPGTAMSAFKMVKMNML